MTTPDHTDTYARIVDELCYDYQGVFAREPIGQVNTLAIQALAERGIQLTEGYGQPIETVRDIRDDLTHRVTTLLRELNV